MKSSCSLVPILLTEIIKKQVRSLKFLRLFIHLISTSCVPSMRQELTAAENMKITYSSNPLSPDIAGRTSDLADNITTMKSSQRKVKKKLSVRYGAIYTHSIGHSRYKKFMQKSDIIIFQMTKPSQAIHFVIPSIYHPQKVIRELHSLFCI